MRRVTGSRCCDQGPSSDSSHVLHQTRLHLFNDVWSVVINAISGHVTLLRNHGRVVDRVGGRSIEHSQLLDEALLLSFVELIHVLKEMALTSAV